MGMETLKRAFRREKDKDAPLSTPGHAKGSAGHALSLLAPLCAGLAVCQALATVWVFRSNQEVLDKAVRAAAAGYLPVPSPDTLPSLASFQTALCGACLFTLSAGAGLTVLFTLIGLGEAKVQDKGILRRAAPYATALALLVWVNVEGLVFWPSAITLFVPLATLAACGNVRKEALTLPKTAVNGMAIALALLLPVAFSYGWLVGKPDSRVFTSLRDSLLLSNPAGQQLNDFYYTYTLGPAEVLKSLAKRQGKTARVEKDAEPDAAAKVKGALLRHDYLPVEDKGPVDLEVRLSKADVELGWKGRALVRAGTQEFFESPGKFLEGYSKTRDRLGNFRALVFWSIVLGLPLFALITAHALATAAVSRFAPPAIAARGAVLLCLCAALGLGAVAMEPARIAQGGQPLRALLTSDTAAERTAGLRRACQERRDACAEGYGEGPPAGAGLAERYWHTQALGFCRGADAVQKLEGLLSDRQRNVACMAFFALGNRGAVESLPKVLEITEKSTDWYIRMYGYGTARRLGWTQGE
jgi:hypothetical protein